MKNGHPVPSEETQVGACASTLADPQLKLPVRLRASDVLDALRRALDQNGIFSRELTGYLKSDDRRSTLRVLFGTYKVIGDELKILLQAEEEQ